MFYIRKRRVDQRINNNNNKRCKRVEIRDIIFIHKHDGREFRVRRVFKQLVLHEHQKRVSKTEK